MNWQAISFDWNQVRAFLATAEEGTFSAAARALRTTQPTVGRQVAGLEEALGVTLFERGTRALVLTRAGVDLLAHVRAMGEAATRVSLAAAGQAQDITGSVSITAVDVFALHYIVPVLARLRKEAPGLVINLVTSNALQDLSRREADIAIRHVRPTQPDLVAKLVATFHAQFYAAPAYLDRVGRPESLADLGRYDIVGIGEPEEFMRIAADRGFPLRADQFPIRGNSGIVTWEMVRAGLGIALFPEEIADADPGLERMFDGPSLLDFPAWLTTHRELHTSRRIRLVYDALAEAMARTPSAR